MTTKPIPRESKMLEEVRRWRKEAFEADRERTLEERAQRQNELIHRFGLSNTKTKPEPNRKRPGQ